MGLKVHVSPAAEQEGVIAPVKLVPEADIGIVSEAVPTRIVLVGEEEERLNCAVPVPERATVCGLPVALSEMLREPLRAPLAVGANVTLAEQVWPGLSRLLTAPQVLVWRKSPLVVMLVMVSVAVPVLVMVTVWGLLVVPTNWLENDRVVGASVTAVPAVTPVPVKLNVCGLLAALSDIESVAVRTPRASGVKVTFIWHVPPLASTVPTQVSVSVNTLGLLLVISVIVRGAVPALITVIVCVALGTLSA